MKTVWICLFFVLIGISLQAEMRYWRNVDGKRFEGEFSKELFDVYYIRIPGGKEIMLPVDKLDPVDAEFLKVSVPPRVEVTFRKSDERKPRHYTVPPEDVIEIVTGKVTIKKTTKLPYSGTLTAEVFMIAKELKRDGVDEDIYRLIAKKKVNFVFGEERNAKQEFTLTGEVRRYPRNDLDPTIMGCEYFGYVVLVTDAKKQPVGFDNDRLKNLKVESIEDLRMVPNRSFFNEFGQRVPVPRPKDLRDASRWMAIF